MSALLATLSATAAAALFALPKAAQRLQLSRAKHPSLTGHARMARRVAGLIPHYAYSQRAFFRSDDPDETVALRRENGFARLSELYRARFARTRAETDAVRDGLSDLQFTGLYRVPFQYAGHVRAHLGAGAFAAASDGVTVTDLDGNVFYDLAGSYGVNLFGVDFYRACLEEGTAKVAALGPVLGPLHPVVTGNVARLKALSGLDEVSFHMSGTEAVMQAVRLARYHTGRRRIVRFCGAYHGWWGEVQPGIGNPVPTRDTLTLADMSDRTLRVLGSRRDVACVLVNPLQAMHPNAGAPSDSALVDSARKAAFDRAAYTKWLAALRAVCTANGIVLIFDEVFLGFRLAQGGAQDYFGVRADMVTYGKTLGGGLPVGVLCGRADLMRRFRDDRPVDICFARGTFNAHPYVMGAMSAFLDRLETPEVAALYRDLDATWDARAARLNTLLAEAELPVRVSTLSTVWTVLYTRPSRYNWMLQFYLRAEGLALSWVGTGRMIFSLAYDDAAFEAVAARFVAAANAMRADGWWDGGATTDKAIRKAILREVAAIRLGKLGARLGLRAPDQV
ncbi:MULTISPECIES: aminotransferase class III-fold pyridoxal phosphate-dependent enzyme [unclassified Methylobacterium]|uniref:aminotransferase class III-fold pyridoxal phosphate-dependent enzyme n=1 Tax=unclassified Methylobacterium TaxID=2615210 RepID=UPI0011C1ECFD|nr:MULTISPECIES: aminotransferase class III-fold pyridoxal phosphate-dependent enzyme [unclassified Methylobacterium]QEE39941.1 aminotransferase class III-fold pyridoxal phosphate-dependent enzyme [Methylobacterium sp. WL1]TXN56609.1 aminotransferase class III-fold pyridoxal phosphate-dependent enzyme [Methylobacterium sp. WL2]